MRTAIVLTRMASVLLIVLVGIVGFCAIRCALVGEWWQAVGCLGFVATALLALAGRHHVPSKR
jgi:hypothetical protein